MQNLQKVMEAIARVNLKPHNVYGAFSELMQTLGEHAQQALLEYDEAVQHELEYRELENENAELRRRLRKQGLSDKVAS
jgi:hypothetical protein